EVVQALRRGTVVVLRQFPQLRLDLLTRDRVLHLAPFSLELRPADEPRSANSGRDGHAERNLAPRPVQPVLLSQFCQSRPVRAVPHRRPQLTVGKDRKSTRLNSSHVKISYAVFCL